MSSAVEIVMTMFYAMNVEEKKSVVVQIGEDADVRALLKPVEEKAKPKKGSGRRGGGKSSPYWIKTVTGFDASQKGMMQVEGDWVNDVKKDMEVGQYALIGTRDEARKQYMLVKRCDASQCSFEAWGKTQTVDCVEQVYSADNFGSIVEKAKTIV